jgi:hypothetical protein
MRLVYGRELKSPVIFFIATVPGLFFLTAFATWPYEPLPMIFLIW